VADAHDEGTALEMEAVHVKDGDAMRIGQADEQLRAVGREFHALGHAFDFEVIEQAGGLRTQVDDRQMAIRLMNQARAVVQAA
jgi:hypothetical protein